MHGVLSLHGTVVLSVGQPVAVTAVFCFCVVHRMPYVQKLQQDCCRFELAWHAVNVG